ncbi:response regulator receiver and Hpt phospho transfer protein [Thalassoporum mexicanum PCC 7367]|uniref:response regulator n=1 Tax=Thalassoporum mexicanum TaxID=3457544 RepID=UPI00029FB656|nr:response regulator [Pseudanabaena sp. PCC 7367]AFY69210.1 response regulator receiver and Hpt phospho transfer protein [Pseudanabaena sp. PCC 7367]
MNFDLRNCTEELLDLIALQAHRKQLELTFLIDDNVPTKLEGDLVRLSQVLTLLLIKAIEVLSEGEIKMRIQLLETTASIVKLEFTVAHSNIFLSDQDQDEIAEFLAQADGWGSEANEQGDLAQDFTTIGTDLAICRSLVQMMAGTMELKTTGSDPETAYCFSAAFNLPDQQTAIAPQADLTGLKLLIVSENASTRAVLSQHAQKWQIKADEVVNSAMAMNALRQAVGEGKPYQIAIIDMQMSVLSGAVLGRTILADASLSNTKLVIACFATQQQESKKLCQQGFAAVLVKPIKQLPLLHALVEAGANLRATNKSNTRAIASTQPQSPIDKIDKKEDTNQLDQANQLNQSDQPITASQPTDLAANPDGAASLPGQQLIDVDHLIKLCEGNRTVINKMLKQFIEDLPHSITALQEAIAQQDFFIIQQNAHFIKGSSATIGMHQVRQRAEQIELEAKTQQTQESNQLIAEIVNITTNLLTQQATVLEEINTKLAVIDSNNDSASSASTNHTADLATGQKQLTVLVVDDDRMTLTLVADSLAKLPNCNIVTANNGKEAWQHLSSTRFDAIVSDWSMPDMSGIVLCQRIKFYPQLPSAAAPFILLTAYSNAEYKKIARDAGVDDFLVKPVDPDALRRMVSLWVAN